MMQHTLAVLHPDDLHALATLRRAPETMFSLVRPLVEPTPTQMEPMQEAITTILSEDPKFSDWQSVAVMPPDNLAATYFDSESVAHFTPRAGRSIGSFALAVHLCSALPRSAMQPVAGIMEKASIGTPRRAHCSVWLGVACREAVQEYAAAGFVLNTLYGIHGDRPSRVPVRLAYIQKDVMDTYIPGVSIRRRIVETVPPGTPIQLDRVRLRIHPPGTSPYVKLK
jgi:hypothetical protein